MARRARCWSPALENLPRTKPRGLSRRFYGESGLGWLVFWGCGTITGSNCRDLALVFPAEPGPIGSVRSVSRRVKIAAGISSASGRSACRCTAACRGFAPVTCGAVADGHAALLAGGARARGICPRSKVSMMIMGPPQRGHGWRRVWTATASAASVSPAAGSSSGGSAWEEPADGLDVPNPGPACDRRYWLNVTPPR